MPKASCQIDGQAGRTIRSMLLATAAARDAALEETDAAAGALAGARRPERHPRSVAANMKAAGFTRPTRSQSSTVVHR